MTSSGDEPAPPRLGSTRPERPEEAEKLVEKTIEKRPDRPPTSRLGRLARLTALAPRALPLAAEAMKRAVGMKRNEDEEEIARKKMMASAKSTAQAMLKTLGEMKGLPLKLGQMASYIDGLAPPGYEAKFQEVLKKLQSKAPPLSRVAAVKVVTEELGSPPPRCSQSGRPIRSRPRASARYIAPSPAAETPWP